MRISTSLKRLMKRSRLSTSDTMVKLTE